MHILKYLENLNRISLDPIHSSIFSMNLEKTCVTLNKLWCTCHVIQCSVGRGGPTKQTQHRYIVSSNLWLNIFVTNPFIKKVFLKCHICCWTAGYLISDVFGLVVWVLLSLNILIICISISLKTQFSVNLSAQLMAIFITFFLSCFPITEFSKVASILFSAEEVAAQRKSYLMWILSSSLRRKKTLCVCRCTPVLGAQRVQH